MLFSAAPAGLGGVVAFKLALAAVDFFELFLEPFFGGIAFFFGLVSPISDLQGDSPCPASFQLMKAWNAADKTIFDRK